MTDLPTGTLTLLFSDIEGSTLLLSRLGDRYGDVLSAQRNIMRTAFSRHHGHEMGTEGDSFFVVFRSVADAVKAAYQAQRGLTAHPWPDGVRVAVRMGLHTGEPVRHEDGYLGMDVHRAARVAACAHGGQVLVSEPTYRLATAQPVSFVDLGWHRLKDIPEAEHLYQLAADDLPRRFPPPKSLGSMATLPLPATPIVGRDAELVALRALITTPDVRLVTLSGAGGCGKTRLAIAAASMLQDDFPDGIYFVALEEVRSVEVMWTSIAEALGTGGDGPARWSLLDHLATRRALLVLDNLEQLTEAADVVADLLAAAPGGAVLATSRRPLRLAEEYEHPVPPLTLSAAEVEAYEARAPGDFAANSQESGAVQLFLQRARMVRPNFSLTPDNRSIVAEICRRLDGLPLAIELAAARIRHIGPRAVLARLDASLEFTGARPGRPARQQTLRSTIAWSFGLLSAEAQVVFSRLGVFAGGGDLAACAALLGRDGDPLDVLSGLVDASLVQLGEDTDGEPRVHLLQTIATFARERLTAAGELHESRQRHADHYLAVVETLAPQLHSSRFLVTRDRIEIELDNLRAALDWALGSETDPPSDERMDIGLRLCQELSWFWYACGYHNEGRRWLSRGVEAAAGRESRELMTTLHGLGVVLQQHGEHAQSRDALLRCLDFWRGEGDPAKIAMELNSLACAHRALGEAGTARSLFEESIATARTVGDDARRAAALSNLAILEVDEDRADRAVELLRETLEIDQRLGDTWGVAHDHNNLATAMVRAGRIAEAHDTLREHAGAALALGDLELSINVIEAFWVVFAESGEAIRAGRLLGATSALRESAELPMAAPDIAQLEVSISKVRDLPDADTWAANVATGSAYSLQDALADALGDAPTRATTSGPDQQLGAVGTDPLWPEIGGYEDGAMNPTRPDDDTAPAVGTPRQIADRYVETMAHLDPILGTMLGTAPSDDRLPDFSPAGIAATNDAARSTLAELDAVPDTDDVLELRCARLLRNRLRASLALSEAGEDLRTVNNIFTPMHSTRQVFLLMPAATEQDWAVIARRMARVPAAHESYRAALTEGASQGLYAAPRQVDALVAQLGQWLGSGSDQSWFASFVSDGPGTDPLREELEEAARHATESVRTTRDFLQGKYRSGAEGTPDAVGAERYARWAMHYTGADLDLDEAYTWAWGEYTRIAAEMQGEADKIRPGSTPAEAMRWLSTDGEAVDGVEAIRQRLQQMMDEAIAALDGNHFDLAEPIRRVEAMIAPAGSAAAPYYTRPSMDFARPGRTWLPTLGRERFPLWDLVSTWYHEGVPGHHLQLAQWVHVAPQLSTFQTSLGSTSADTEGWALYAERLMNELGFLTGQGHRLGYLDAQQLRAVRVIIDIGMHLELEIPAEQNFHPGRRWTPELGREFFAANSGRDPDFGDSELVRYLGVPGQAISYKLGERAWLAGRAAAQRRQGAGFDLKRWHMAALSLGSVGLADLTGELSAL